jgi:lipopolysaccharide transport system ATP-binding protein
MSEIIVKNISKKFKLSGINNGATLRDQIMKIARHPVDLFRNNQKKDFWALQNINFEVNKGDILGVIGKNGSGKSTLLKIISRILTPTEGKIILRGKVASLLEVGTGFHPELSGRENIFLNCSIYKMSSKEIKNKFQEIVEFSGIGKFLDTPIKFYSSGMYVRLAFAVAAHINSDILLFDEVLSVGDYEFQEKCIKKINSITKNSERTIIFVSHNMEAIKNICTKVIWLKEGKIFEQGETTKTVRKYLNSDLETKKNIFYQLENAPGNELVKLKSFKVVAKNCNDTFFTVNTPLEIQCEFWSFNDLNKFNVSIVLFNTEQCVFNSASPVVYLKKGLNRFSCLIPGGLLNDGIYYVEIMLVNNSSVIYKFEESCTFNLIDEREHEWYGKWIGVVRPKLDWKIEVDI